MRSGVEAWAVLQVREQVITNQDTSHIFSLSRPNPPGPIERQRRDSQSIDITNKSEWQEDNNRKIM